MNHVDPRALRTVVLVHAHPDDETLWTGGLIAQLARQGDTRIVVVTCTRGERGEVITAPGTATEDKGWLFGNHEALAEHRINELKAALAALGNGYPIEHYFLDELPLPDGGQVSELPVPSVEEGFTPSRNHGTRETVRYVDSGMRWLVEPSVEGDDPRTSTGGVAEPDPEAADGFATAPLDDAAACLAGLLNDLEGNINLVTYEADGGYGHPDHVRAHAVAVRALEMTGPAASGRNLELWEVTKPGEPYDVAVPVTAVLPKLLAAMRAYASQVQGVTEDVDPAAGRVGWFALSNGVPLAIKDHEYYRVTPFRS